jgi:hypothetical protein
MTMSRTATFYLLKIEDLQKLNTPENAAQVKKSFLGLKKKSSDTVDVQMSEIAVEKMQYRWSGLAYTLLAVFAKEKLGIDWGLLEYKDLADELSERYEAGVYIFSAKDEALFAMKPNGYFYNLEELNEFSVEVQGQVPANSNVMDDAVRLLNEVLSKVTQEQVALLLIR